MIKVTQDPLVKVPQTTHEEFNEAVSSARLAFETWRDVPLPIRVRTMFEFQHLLKAN
jgi:malonate-semialdehyde dehydrogenase (acetylating)/methylmalonate-semialdehyde dehydrogenase